MMLLSLLIALLIERVTAKTEHWRATHYVQLYTQWLVKKGYIGKRTDRLTLLLTALIPSVLCFVVLHWLGHGIIGLIANTLLLFVCLGCPQLRATYKCYLQAADRGDIEACELYTEALGHVEQDAQGATGHCGTFAQHLVWLNYTHYAAVIVAFILFGGAGAVFYVLCYGISGALTRVAEADDADDDAQQNAQQLMYAVDFLPVRITALGFLMVGHFGRALPVWLNHTFSLDVSTKQLLCDVTHAAEDVTEEDLPHDSEHTRKQQRLLSEPKILVKLAKRNIIFLMVTVSILTVSGVLH
ncbi:beta-lactamase regulator AmpE [Alteromonas oceanisediminis]|uniref:beta-lactamase regulator AmpE n=1 Tax=Alteromonas oceanisediminis TaxID=2836180 RepID=UPI001BD9DED9|nr:beta-lactamase regulator AmpE [Alteromonas oceanisediminis]MBT0585546.1 beta-lactamase regulator AmpE [Alteromonas oceanisediminis]